MLDTVGIGEERAIRGKLVDESGVGITDDSLVAVILLDHDHHVSRSPGTRMGHAG
jgi:hypothetical protein